MDMTMEAEAGAPRYPVYLDIPRPQSQSRLTNFPLFGSFIRMLLAIPHLIILYALGIVAAVMYFIAAFAILFTGRYPLGMFNFSVGVSRWNAGVTAYLYHLVDDYPPFSMDPAAHKVNYLVEYPAQLNRFLNFPLYIGAFIKTLLLIPHFLVFVFLGLGLWIVILIGQFAILFTGSFPVALHSFAVGVMRWSLRLNGYIGAYTDQYPPFSLK